MLKRTLHSLSLVLALAIPAMASAQSDVGAAVGLGGTKGLEIFNTTKTQPPTSAIVPGYNGATQSQQGYFQNGQGNTVGPGAAKATGCTSANDPECLAVNLIQWGPSNRPKPTFNANDPLIAGAKDKLKNPAATVGSFAVPGGSTAGILTNASGQCQQVTTTTPATYSEHICDENAQISSNLCALLQVVKVDAKYDFNCEKTNESKSDRNCNRTLDVACVGSPPTYSCTDGSTPLNGICSATVSTTSPANISGYTCPNGTTLQGQSCVTTTTSPATTTYSCPVGSTLVGQSCTSTSSVTTPATATYSCPVGATLSGSSCITTSNTTTPATPIYFCPNGSVLSGSNCVSTNTSSATPVFTCPVGYTSNYANCSMGTTTAAYQTISCPAWTTQSSPSTCNLDYLGNGWCPVLSVPLLYQYDLQPGAMDQTICVYGTQASYSCPAGQTLSGSTCYGTTTIPATVGSYTCPAGQTLQGQSCLSTTTTPASVTGYSCPVGQVLSGNQCTQTTTTTTAATPIYTCNVGETLSGTTCTKLVTTTSPASPVYTCSVGFVLNGTSCVQSTSVPATPTYSCTSGTLSGSVCVNTTSSAAGVAGSCPAGMGVGTFWTSSGNCGNCYFGSNNYVGDFGGKSWYNRNLNPGSRFQYSCTNSYACPGGQTLSGNQCYQTTNVQANVSYSCGAGATLSGSQCVTTNTVPATVSSYTCPAGQTLSGQTCSLTTTVTTPATAAQGCPVGAVQTGNICTTTTTTTSAATPVYSCAVGQTLSGQSCVTSTVQPATPEYSCLPGGVLNGTACTYAVTTTSNANENYSCTSGNLTQGAMVNGKQTYVCCTESVNNACQALEGLAQ